MLTSFRIYLVSRKFTDVKHKKQYLISWYFATQKQLFRIENSLDINQINTLKLFKKDYLIVSLFLEFEEE